MVWRYETRARLRERQQQSISRNRAWYAEFSRGIVCVKCGNPEVEWHHRVLRRKGDVSVGQLVNGPASIARIQQEIAKCDPVCVGCHKKLHLRTHCIRGHEFTPDNTLVFPGGTKRHCIKCRRMRPRP